MEYRVLRYFLTVAREQNITRAAEMLHISQPALSRQLMQLEEELGTQLLVRGKRTVTLTEAGHLLRRRAQEIVDLTEKTEHELQAGAEAVGGVISVGSGEAETMRPLALLMKEFGAQYPAVRFELYSNNADYIRERLDRGALDIGILIEPCELSRYEYIRLPQRERWGAYLSAADPLAQKEWVGPQDLAGRRLLIPKRGAAIGVADWFGDLYDRLDIFVSYNLLYNAAMLVDCGVGAALAIEGAGGLYKNPNIVFRPFQPELTVSSVLVWKKYQPMSAAVEKFVALARARFAHFSG